MITTTNRYLYSLDRSSRKYLCPGCGCRTLVRYIDSAGMPLADEVGKCDRVNNCGYHLPPRSYMAQHPERRRSMSALPPRRSNDSSGLRPSYIPMAELAASLSERGPNNLLTWLARIMAPYGLTQVDIFSVASLYRVGTSRAFGGGAVTFWQIDHHGRIRTGKTMAYNPQTGCRIKEPRALIRWAHTPLRRRSGYNLRQCLFGAHLLATSTPATVLLLESEKAALIVAMMLHSIHRLGSVIPVATGGCSNLPTDPASLADDFSAVAPLKGRRVVMAPDSGMYSDWARKAEALRGYCSEVSILTCTERTMPVGAGFDDLLLRRPAILRELKL